jgi:hypothetical protein
MQGPRRAPRPSTRALDALPSIEGLIQRSRALAMLDAVLSPEWEHRYYSFDSAWGDGEMMASMRNGSGDEYFILFDGHGAVMKGFDHESIMSPWSSEVVDIWPGMYARVPDEFSSFINEPAFSIEDVTFCIWRRASDARWHCGIEEFPPGDDPDGSEWMLEVLGGDPAAYQKFAREYYETELPLPAIEHVYRMQPLDQELLGRLNSALSLEDIRADASEIGYPVS